MADLVTSADDVDALRSATAALRSAVAEFFADRCDESALRAAMATDEGYDDAAWQVLGQQLGVAGLVAPESAGGSGCGLRELAVVLEEAGRVVYGGPLLGHSLAVWALRDAGAELGDALAALADGTKTGTVALPHQVADSAAPGVTAEAGRLQGVAPYVLHGANADLLVVAADTGLWLVDSAAAVRAEPVPALDPTRPVVTLQFEAAAARQIGGSEAVTRLHDVAATLLACEQVGGAAAVLSDAVEYAKLRHQFGQPIGAFQAIKHHCADALLAVESARAIARRAARAVDAGDAELPTWASSAKAWCSRAYVETAEMSLQVHGGIGFTWEHSTHLHLKRAKSAELLFGDPRSHRSRLGRLLGLSL